MSIRHRVFAVGLTLMFLASIGQAQEQVPEVRQQAAPQQDEVQPLPIPFPVELVENPAAYEARQRGEEEARQREVADLAAQQGMNAATQSIDAATRDMRDYARTSNWLVAIGTVLLILTLILTWQANRAAVSAVEVTRQVGIAQVRAYVDIKHASIIEDPNKPGSLRVALVMQNFGASPARNMKRRWVQYHGEKASARDAHPHFGDPGPMPEIAPGNTHTTHFEIDPMTIKEINDAHASGKQFQYRVCGVISYEDIFGAERKQFFSYRTAAGDDICARSLHLDEDGNYGED